MKTDHVFFRKADGPVVSLTDYPRAMVEACLDDIVEGVLGHKSLTRSLAALGTYHYVYDLQVQNTNFIIKIPKNDMASRTLFLEYAVYVLLGKVITGVDVIHFDARKTPFPFLIMTKASGVCLRTIDIDRPDFKSFILGMARKMIEFHQLPLPADGYGLAQTAEGNQCWQGSYQTWSEYLCSHLEEHLRFNVDYEVINTAQARTIEGYLNELADLSINAPALLHGDLGAHNIFVDNGSYAVKAIIDWEDVMIGDPLFDVAIFASFYRMEEFACLLLDSYVAILKLNGKQWERLFWLYYLRIILSKTLVRYKFGYDKHKGQSQISPKIKVAMAKLK